MVKSLENVLENKEVSLSVLTALAENSFDSILITDVTEDSKIIYANNAFEKSTGYNPDAVPGKTPRLLQGPATDKKVIVRLSEALQKAFVLKARRSTTRRTVHLIIMYWRVVPAKTGENTKVWLAIHREGTTI